MLDPWAEDPTLPLMKADSGAQGIQPDGSPVLISVRNRTNAPQFPDDDDGVVTSAAPLEATLRRPMSTDGKLSPPPAETRDVRTADPAGEPPSPGEPGPADASDCAGLPQPAKAGKSAPPSTTDAPAAEAPPTETVEADVEGGRPSATAQSATIGVPRTAAKPLVVPRPSPASTSEAYGATAGRPPVPSALRPKPLTASAFMSSASSSRPMARITGTTLETVDALADLPSELQERFAALARVITLPPGGGLPNSVRRLCLRVTPRLVPPNREGAIVCPATTFLPTHGSLKHPVSLCIVAGGTGARLAVWDQPIVREALHSCPWVLDELKVRADRLHALSGVLNGPLGALSEVRRDALMASLAVRSLEPNEVLVEAGQAKIGLLLVGAGAVELAQRLPDPAQASFFPVAASCSVTRARGRPQAARRGQAPMAPYCWSATRPLLRLYLRTTPFSRSCCPWNRRSGKPTPRQVQLRQEVASRGTARG